MIPPSPSSKPSAGSHGHADAHDQGCGHGHEGHSHGDTSTTDGRRRVAISFFLIASFMFVEVAGGLVSGSLALLADAAHMLTDAASLGLAWLGYKLSTRPADETRTFGFARVRVLAAFTNGIALIALAVWILAEGIERLANPQPVMGPLLLGIAVIGLLVNLICFGVLHGGDREDLNLRGALWHVAGDLLGSLAAIIAALIIIQTGWLPIDPILSMLVALLVLIAGVRISRQAGHILVQGTPKGLSPQLIKTDLEANIEGIAEITDLHVWSLTEKDAVLTLHITAKTTRSASAIRADIRARLAMQWPVKQVTIEISQPATSASD